MKISISIDVPTLEDGIPFYGDAFAFTESSWPHPSYSVLESGAARNGLLAKAAGTRPAKDTGDVRRSDRHWTPVHIDFDADDFDAVERAKARGAKCEEIHRTSGYPPGAFCSNPFGHGFCIIAKRA